MGGECGKYRRDWNCVNRFRTEHQGQRQLWRPRTVLEDNMKTDRKH
jgi:hypothetical protein